MVEPKEDGKDKINCESCSLKADIVQYCIDSEIGPFNKFSQRNAYYDHEMRTTIYLSLLQLILVTTFLVVTLSVSHGPFTFFFRVAILVAAVVIVFYIVFHIYFFRANTQIHKRDIKESFQSAYRCISDQHEPVLLTTNESLTHMLTGSSHHINQVKLKISTFSFSQPPPSFLLFVSIWTIAISIATAIVNNEATRYLDGASGLAQAGALILTWTFPALKKDVDLVKFEDMRCEGDYYISVYLSLYAIATLTFKKLTRNLDLSKMCYVPFESFREGKIYFIESISGTFLKKINQIKFILDDEKIRIEDLPRLITKRSLSKWKDTLDKDPNENNMDH